MRRFLVLGLSVLLALTGLVALAPRAAAAQADWAAFTFDAATKTGTMQQRAAGFPRADIVTNSAGGGIGVQSGASTFLPPQSPPAQKYGTSQGDAYLNLRPAGRTTAQASVTTYTFERPTPATGWTFVLGDIDADQVTITATDADGAPVDPADLNFQGGFNYCAPGVSPKPSCAPPNNDGSFEPTWNVGTGVLLGDTPQFRDTAGSSAWFEPSVALSSLTFTYALRQGSPVYQTWFSALEYDLTGTVTAPAGQAGGIELRLLDADGKVVDTTQTAADGSYSFPGLATFGDWRVALVLPDGLAPADGQELTEPADLSTDDDVVDFDLRAVVGRSVGGQVTLTDANGDPVPGVTVRLTGNGVNREAVTDAEGRYLFDDVAAGTGYTVTALAPDGTTVNGPFTVDVPANADPADQNFVVTPPALGTLRGQVTVDGSGDPVPNALIVITGPGGEREVRTDENGAYELADLEAGDYTVTVQPEGGATVVGSASRTTTITSAGETRDGLDFELAPPPVERQTASGTVTDEDGEPVAGATITATDPYDGEEFTDVTGEDGRWIIDGLYPDVDWTATVDPPEGYQVVGSDTRTFDLLDDTTGVDFVLARVATPTPEPTDEPTEEPTEEPSAVAVSGDGLADTGGPALAIGLSGLLLVGGAVTILRGRRR